MLTNEHRTARERRIKDQYAELRATDPDAYRRCIYAAGALAINANLSLEQSAAVEEAMIDLALSVKR